MPREQKAAGALLRGENRPPRSRLRLDLPTKRRPKGVNNKSGARREKKFLWRRYKEAKDRIAGVSGRRSRARTKIVKADSPPPLVPRNPDYLYSELLYVTRILRAREREKSLAGVFLSRAGGRRSACLKLHIRNFNFGI